MTQQLPHPVGPYYEAKNRQDIDTMITLFADDAVVVDEGSDRRGHDQIYEWMTNTTKRLAVQSEIIAVVSQAGRDIVTAVVSGDFTGSPVTLNYAFTLRDEKIARLEIA